MDFKTDRVLTDAEVRRRAEQYRPQLEAYSRALERVLERPVVRRELYFLRAGCQCGAVNPALPPEKERTAQEERANALPPEKSNADVEVFKRSYDFPQRRLHQRLLLAGVIPDDVFAGDDAGKLPRSSTTGMKFWFMALCTSSSILTVMRTGG